VPNINRQSHKRSQSLNKSSIEQRYRSVPQNNHYQNEKYKKVYSKKKLNCFFNNKTPQVHLSKSKNETNQLDVSLKNAKKNLHNYFKDNNTNNTSHDYAKQNFASLTGREKGNTLLRKVYLRMENDYPTSKQSFRNMGNKHFKRNESSKKGKAGTSKNKVKGMNGRFISPIFKSERSASKKNSYPKNKCNISDINKIQTLLTSIRSSRSNKMSKGGTDSVKKNAYNTVSSY
jgi:hypothetical protein